METKGHHLPFDIEVSSHSSPRGTGDDELPVIGDKQADTKWSLGQKEWKALQ